MRWKKTLLLLLLSVATVNCESKDSSPASPAKDPAKNGSDAIGDDGKDDGELVEAKAEVLSLTYSAEAHAITAEISYGGCAATKHQLILSDICAESYPMQCSARLMRMKDFDASCKMLIKETVVLELAETFDTSHVRVPSLDKSVSVLVDRENKIDTQMP